MPTTIANGHKLHWQSEGAENAQPLLLLNSLGTDLAMWDFVSPTFGARFHLLRMDVRGHGASDTVPGSFTISSLADDAIAVLDAAGVQRAHVCGLSMGGMIALELGLSHPDRVNGIVVSNSSAAVPAEPWQARAAKVRSEGMSSIVDVVMERFFSDRFRQTEPATVEAFRKTFVENDPEGYAACCMAISHVNMIDKLDALAAPLLVINGALDNATPPQDHGDRIADAVAGADAVTLETGHISAAEAPSAYSEAVTGFLLDR